MGPSLLEMYFCRNFLCLNSNYVQNCVPQSVSNVMYMYTLRLQLASHNSHVSICGFWECFFLHACNHITIPPPGRLISLLRLFKELLISLYFVQQVLDEDLFRSKRCAVLLYPDVCIVRELNHKKFFKYYILSKHLGTKKLSNRSCKNGKKSKHFIH